VQNGKGASYHPYSVFDTGYFGEVWLLNDTTDSLNRLNLTKMTNPNIVPGLWGGWSNLSTGNVYNASVYGFYANAPKGGIMVFLSGTQTTYWQIFQEHASGSNSIECNNNGGNHANFTCCFGANGCGPASSKVINTGKVTQVMQTWDGSRGIIWFNGTLDKNVSSVAVPSNAAVYRQYIGHDEPETTQD
jgi:hypothetical protein